MLIGYSMHQNHTISIYFARTILGSITDDGEMERLLSCAGIQPALLKNIRNRITPLQFSQLIKAVSKKYKDEFLGLSEKPMPLGSFLLLARNAIHCDNLIDVYQQTEMALTTMTKQLSIKLIVEENQACVYFEVEAFAQKNKIILTELAMLIWHRFPSWLAGKEIPLDQVCLPYGKTAHISEYPLMFSTDNISFNCDAAKIIFPIKYLNSPCQRSLSELKNYILKLPDFWFKRVEFEDKYRAVSSECLKHMETSSTVDMELIANKMNKSIRTLRRNLSIEKTSFQQLKAQYLRDKAIHLITETNASIEVIANRLGYTEASTFSRVFKQWTGSSPRDYRNFIK